MKTKSFSIDLKFLTQSKLLCAENEKLIQDAESQKEKYEKVSENLKKEAKKCEQYRIDLKSVMEHYEKEIKSLSAKLSDEQHLHLL